MRSGLQGLRCPNGDRSLNADGDICNEGVLADGVPAIGDACAGGGDDGDMAMVREEPCPRWGVSTAGRSGARIAIGDITGDPGLLNSGLPVPISSRERREPGLSGEAPGEPQLRSSRRLAAVELGDRVFSGGARPQHTCRRQM